MATGYQIKSRIKFRMILFDHTNIRKIILNLSTLFNVPLHGKFRYYEESYDYHSYKQFGIIYNI